MKYSTYFTLLIAVCLSQPYQVEARIGDSLADFERRLFSAGGIAYPKEEEEGKQSRRPPSGPYSQYLDYLGSSAEARIYFKSDDGQRPRQVEIAAKKLGSGWEVHVLFVSGKSVLELYKRVGGSTSEYETNALLGLLGGGGFWKEPEPPVEGEEAPPSAFGFDYVRNDGEVRAKKSGGGLMVFRRQLDEYLAKKHDSTLQEKAPVSVQGF